MKRLIQATVLASALLWAGSATAADWVVTRVIAPAKYTVDGNTWNPVESGLSVPNSAWINTGGGGRVQLRRGSDTMLINGYTLVASVERGTDAQPRTTLHQKFGEMTVDVAKRDYDQMTVKTPFMVAVIKGTKFTVTGTELASTLSVARGLVEVANAKSGQKAYIGAGGKAEVGATANSVELSGSNTSLLTSSTTNGNGKSQSGNAGAGNNNAGGNSNGAGNSGNSNAGGNGNSNSGPGNNNAGGNSNGAGNSENSNAGGNR